jgi:glycosyltransferase involved in cell wall biosynthesis
MEPSLKISVIVPAHNAERVLPRCLDSLANSSLPPHEVIVIDDRSSDGTRRSALDHASIVLETKTGRGPGAARNLGARHASGEILLFVDADVEVLPDTLERVAANFENRPSIAAVFGSYDDEPADPGFLSQYKNLQHHYVHQTGNAEASTFWAGCGAVRKEVFLEMGGFDLRKYPEPSIEDIEFGYRMRAKGHRTILDKSLLVKHLKTWRFWPLMRTEIFCRAAPWSRLILESGGIVRDLNLRLSDRVSAGLVWLLVLLLPLPIIHPAGILLPAACLASILVLNRSFYLFFLRRRGPWFTFRVVPMHLLYYLYSSLVFAVCWLRYRMLGA